MIGAMAHHWTQPRMRRRHSVGSYAIAVWLAAGAGIVLGPPAATAAPLRALVDREPGSGAYEPGAFASMMAAAGLSYDLFGTDPAAQQLQLLYDNIGAYDEIYFADNAGRDSTIHTVVQDPNNQATLENWVASGGRLYMGVYNDAGDASYFTPPGFAIDGIDRKAAFQALDPDPVLSSPNDVLSAMAQTGSWERLASFPTGATDTRKVLADPSYSSFGYVAVASFRYGAGLVIWSGIPMRTLHPNWPGADEITPGTGEAWLQNVAARFGSFAGVAVPEPRSAATLALGLLAAAGLTAARRQAS